MRGTPLIALVAVLVAGCGDGLQSAAEPTPTPTASPSATTAASIPPYAVAADHGRITVYRTSDWTRVSERTSEGPQTRSDLLTNDGPDAAPVLAPDGRTAYFARELPNCEAAVMKLDRQGGEPSVVAKGKTGLFALSLSGDGRTLATLGDDACGMESDDRTRRISVHDLSAGTVREWTTELVDDPSRFEPNDIALDDDGSHLYLRGRAGDDLATIVEIPTDSPGELIAHATTWPRTAGGALGSIQYWGAGKLLVHAGTTTNPSRNTLEVRGPSAADRIELTEIPDGLNVQRLDADPDRAHVLVYGAYDEGTWVWSREGGLVKVAAMAWPSW